MVKENRDAGTYKDTRTSPDHVLRETLEGCPNQVLRQNLSVMSMLEYIAFGFICQNTMEHFKNRLDRIILN